MMKGRLNEPTFFLPVTTGDLQIRIQNPDVCQGVFSNIFQGHTNTCISST